MKIKLGFNAKGKLITPISTIPMSEKYIKNNFPDVVDIVDQDFKKISKMKKPLVFASGAIIEFPEDKAKGFIEPAGDFIGRLPMYNQGLFELLIEQDNPKDQNARVLNRFISTGGNINTASPKTIGSVMYLAGNEIADESGKKHTLKKPIITQTQALAWLAGEKVIYEEIVWNNAT